MVARCFVFIATSLDGFIARTDGRLDWLPGSDGASLGEDFGYSAFFEAMDALVMGRKTYELTKSFNQSPFQGKRVYVLSRRHPEQPHLLEEGVYGTSMTPSVLLRHLETLDVQNVYVDGARAIQSFLNDGLIEEMTITRIPVLIGEGIPLFGPIKCDIPLQHVSSRAYGNGFVQSKYRLIG